MARTVATDEAWAVVVALPWAPGGTERLWGGGRSVTGMAAGTGSGCTASSNSAASG